MQGSHHRSISRAEVLQILLIVALLPDQHVALQTLPQSSELKVAVMDVVAKPQESDESDPGSSDAEEVLETAKDSAHLNGQENQKPSSKTRVASQPQLFSADDSHAFWPQPNTAWLLSAASKRTTTDPSNGKEHSGLGVLYSGPHADAHVGKTYDVARMSMTQLLAAAAKHSKGRGIPEEPVKQYLYGYRGQVVPERDAYPFTLGGSNARKCVGHLGV